MPHGVAWEAIFWIGLPSALVTTTVSGLGKTSTFTPPTLDLTALSICRRLIAGAAYLRTASAGVNGKSSFRLIGFQRDADAVLAGGADVELGRLAAGPDAGRLSRGGNREAEHE